MTKWEPYTPTIYDIMCRADEKESINAARMLWQRGIDPNNEFNYYFDSLMWVINHVTVANVGEFENHYGYTDLGNFFGISNGRVFIKIKGKFENNYLLNSADINLNKPKQDSPFGGLWGTIADRCTETRRQPLTSKDVAVIKDLMAYAWSWHIQFVFDYLGHCLTPKEEENPFDTNKKSQIASPRENANFLNVEFFTKEQQQKQKISIGKSEFSIIAIWLALKLMRTATASKRSFGVYTYKFDDGDQQSYLKITADENECYICGETEISAKC